MKRIFTEELILLVSVLKWIFLSGLIGVIVGIATAVFLKALDFGIALDSENSLYRVLLPLSLFVSAFLVRKFAPEARGHGTEKVIEAVHRNSGRIDPAIIPVKFLSTVITIAGGGSAGKEGPAAQIGAGLSSFFAGLLRFDDNDRKKLVICGVSAGFASVFGTPVAGALFGVEVLFIGGVLYNVLLPSIVAGITSFHVASALGVEYFYHPVNFPICISTIFSQHIFFKVILSGIFFGLCALVFIESMRFFKRLSERIRIWEPLKNIAGGIALVALTAIFSRRYLGLGTETVRLSLAGEKIVWYGFLLKILFTSITLGFGGSGGVVTPIFFIGASSGVVFATLASGDTAFFAALGFVALLAGAANTPIAAAVMSVEMFGSGILMYAATACVISFFITGHRSIFPSQVMRVQKSTSIALVSGRDVEHLILSLKKRNRSLIGLAGTVVSWVRRKLGRGR